MSEADDGLLNTRLLMSASAVYTGLLGLAAALFEEEILSLFGAPADGFSVVLVGVVGGLYIGYAVLNWMARGNLIGGIYSRPVAMGNFAHFLAVSVLLVQRVPSSPHAVGLAVPAGLSVIFAAAFGWIVFGKGGSCG